ncbi:MAG TPA: hypothetical protein VGL17_07215 [Gemmatimonadaceae bacterium]
MRWTIVAAATLLPACRPQSTRPADAVQTLADTVRGTFVLEGNDPFPVAAMHTSAGRVILDGAPARMLKLSQLNLWVSGTRTSDTRFRVSDYRVREANGARAWDGVLRAAAAGFTLEFSDGSAHAISGAPSSFVQLVGSRVWLTENADGSVREYGVL